jgi:Family of unknown function (DUF6159)
MTRLFVGWKCARQSLAIVRKDGALTSLAAIGFALGLVLAAAPLVLAAWGFDADNEVVGWVGVIVAFLAFYIGLTFSAVAIAVAASQVIDGKDAKVAMSVSAAVRRLGPIIGWSVVGTLVAGVLALARKKGGRAGDVAADVGKESWSVVTFLAVPVIAFEGVGPIATLKRSAALFRQRWGEQFTGTVSISLVFFLLSLPALALLITAIALAADQTHPTVVAVALAIVGLVALAAIGLAGRAASATFGAILYRYATTADVPAGVAPGDLQNLGRPAPSGVIP